MTKYFPFHSPLIIAIFLLSRCFSVEAQIKTFKANESVTWEEAIEEYRELDYRFENTKLYEAGITDIGKPLYIFEIDERTGLSPREKKPILFINNGIHPGEPCGIDASLKFAKDLLEQPTEEMKVWLRKVKIVIIPVYNVGGALNRGCCSRANQAGPEAYGFRGNAKNLDLNRDFIKTDSKNAQSFAKIFRRINPHVFIDTHTSNGADYQYVMTMINSQPDKASRKMGEYVRKKMSPALYESMDEKGFGMTPYVYTMKKIPDEGIKDFLETPRYSTGYAALFGTIGFTSETHMLKPFAQRVESTYQFLMSTLNYMAVNQGDLIELKYKLQADAARQKEFPLRWELDTTSYRMIPFKGFEAEYPKSEISGQPRLKYNQKKPFIKEIKYFDKYNVTKSVRAPEYYVIPQAWDEVINRLNATGVNIFRFERDTTINVEAYVINDFTTSSSVYEGHHPNTVNEMDTVRLEKKFYAGDVFLKVNQITNRYIVETLEPEGMDSFFTWNFFDSAMQQKEWYSEYVFEDFALDMLKKDKDLRNEFEAQKMADENFSNNPGAQLFWLYKRSPYFETTVNLYPVYRWNP